MAPGKRGVGTERATEGAEPQPPDVAGTSTAEEVVNGLPPEAERSGEVEVATPVTVAVQPSPISVSAHPVSPRPVQQPAKTSGGKSVAELMRFERRIVKRR